MPVGDPIQPFDARLSGVTGLLPQATFPDALGVGQKGVTKAMIDGYITDLTGRVLVRVAGWERLNADYQAAVKAAARDAIHNGAASYAQAARFPEQADKTDESYATVLWSRYVEGVEQLEQLVAGWLNDPDKATPEGTSGTAGWYFPPARITEDTRF